MFIVTLEDATNGRSGIKEQYCRKGIRLFCKKYSLDYNDFRLNGISSVRLQLIGDSMGLKAVAVARDRIKNEEKNSGRG